MLPEGFQEVGRQRPRRGGSDVRGQVLRPAHPGDDRRHVRVREDEPQGELGERLALRHERAKRLDARDRRLQVRLPEVRVPPIRLGPAARERQRAGQASLVERDPGDDRHSELPAGREELVLRRLVEDVVDDLDRVDEARPERAEDVGGLPPVDADPDVASEALPPQVGGRALPAGIVGPRGLPDVELHEAEGRESCPAQDRLDRRPDVVRREGVPDPVARPGRPLPVLRRNLRGEEEVAAGIRAGELAQELVTVARAVDERGVEERDPGVHRGLEHGQRLAVVGAGPAADPAAHPPHADPELAHGPAGPPEGPLLHRHSVRACAGRRESAGPPRWATRGWRTTRPNAVGRGSRVPAVPSQSPVSRARGRAIPRSGPADGSRSTIGARHGRTMRSKQAFPAPPDRERRWTSRERRLLRREAEPDAPILAELFSVERLEQHAQTLAAAQAITDTPRHGRPVGPRIAENGRVLLDAYRILAQAIKDERSITPAAEWLVDNFPIVDEQLREIRDDLPPDYYRELPKLAAGHLDGYPRVMGLAWAYIAHTDSRFDPESLRRMVRAYQAVEPLTIGELWAIAISLRILLVENLRRLAEEIVHSRADRQRADELADRLLGLGADGPEIGPTSRRLSAAALPTAARVQLFQRLRDQDPAVTPAVRWLEDLLASQGTTAEEVVRMEHQRQATMNVTVRNVIMSMRLISWFDWAEFVESVSAVDEVLRAGSRFAEMDFATRNRYRHAIEVLARGAGGTEIEVARRAVAMAADSAGAGAAAAGASAPGAEAQLAAPDLAAPGLAAQGQPAQGQPAHRRDPGYFLIADGRLELERALDARVPLGVRLRRAYIRTATASYLGTVASVTAVLLAVPLALSW